MLGRQTQISQETKCLVIYAVEPLVFQTHHTRHEVVVPGFVDCIRYFAIPSLVNEQPLDWSETVDRPRHEILQDDRG